MSMHDEMPPAGDEIAVARGLAPFSMIPEWLLMHPDLSGEHIRLYGLLYRYAPAYPSRSRLARQLRCSVDSIDRYVKVLVKAKALTVTKRQSPEGDNTSNLYTLEHNPPEGAAVLTVKDVPEAKPKNTSKARPQKKKDAS